MLSPDSPIQSSKEDLLGRSDFASALVKAIAGAVGPDSFVVGIHGRWGTGKSSVLNLLVEGIASLNRTAISDEQRLYVLRFNPWHFSDQSQLVFQFLKQFRAHLTKFERSAKKTVQSLVDSLDDYAEALAPPLELIPYGGKILSHGAKFAFRGARRLLGSAKEIEDIFGELQRQSAALKRRTIVLIDDIDRLNAAETRQIFQLVKLTARFPYVTYVLAFDRSAVAAALKEIGVDSGEEYLEKIVQVSFDLPAISEATLSSFITQGLDALLAKYKPAHFDSHRFANLFHGGFRSCFSSVRHVRRFLNGLEFSLSLVGGELNGVDVIGVEALKTFYPRTFEAVRDNEDLFAGHVDSRSQELGYEQFRKKLDGLMSTAGEMNDECKSLLVELFPKLEYAYAVSHTIHGHDWEGSWEKEYRVASARYFSAYFQLALAPREITVGDLSRLIRDCVDKAKCSDSLKPIARHGKLKAAMDSLRFRLHEVPAENLESLLAALVETGDLASQSGAIFAGQIPEYFHVRWAIFDVLDRIPADERPTVLLNVANTVFAPRTMVNLIALLEDMRQKESKYTEFSNEKLQGIKAAVVGKISAAAAAGEISDPPESLTTLLHAWREWGNRAEAAAYVHSQTTSDEKLAKFLNKFIYQTHSAGVGDHAMKTHNRLATKQLSDALDLNVLQQRLSRICVERMSDEDRDVIKFTRSQIQKLIENGLTPEQFDNNRFLDD